MTWIGELISEIGQVGLWLQALGVVIVLVITFDIISFIFNRKKLKEIQDIKKSLRRVESKINSMMTHSK